jgi:heme/copper-type cytochrome/quinol oxidase subunit 4
VDYIFAFGMIIFGLTAFIATIFKYTKDEHKKDNFSTGSSDLVGFVFSLIMTIFPWWFAKTVFILISIGVIFVGVMMFLTI